jgi:hypothetical protein
LFYFLAFLLGHLQEIGITCRHVAMFMNRLREHDHMSVPNEVSDNAPSRTESGGPPHVGP